MAISDFFQGCSNKSDTVMHDEQASYKVDDTIKVVTILLYHDCIGLVGTTLQQI
jgi:hypothetical protein